MVKLALLLAALPFHAFFGLALMNSHTLFAPTYYRGLALPWVNDLIGDQRLGGAIAWGATELPIIIVMIALLAQWAKADDRENRRTDRRKDTHGDEELAAYNNMLASMAAQSGVAPTDLLSQLSRHLPGLVDRMTPNGTLPSAGGPGQSA